MSVIERVRVLLVDDEPTFIDSLAKVLGRRGIAATVAYSGDDGVAAAAASEFDVIVLDMRMPGRDGVATMRAIRERGDKTPVLLLSAHAEVEMAVAALTLGATDYLVKPCPVDRLHAAILDAAERKEASAPR